VTNTRGVIGGIDVALTKCLQVNLLVVRPKDGKRTPHPKEEGLFYLGPNPLEGDPETTPQRAHSRAHLDRPKGIAH
jgi:hypothetical protein